MKNFFIKLDRVLVRIQEWILIVSCIEVTGIIVIAAFMRYILKKDFFGAEEIILAGAFWLYFIGSSLATREDSHICADFLGTVIKNVKIKNLLMIVRNAISVSLSCLFTVWTIQYVLRSIKLMPLTSALKFPQLLLQIPIAISFVLMTIYFLILLWKSIKKYTNDNKEVFS